MVLRPPDTPLNVTCECGKPVPIPNIITKGYEQTIALQQKVIEDLTKKNEGWEVDKRSLQADLRNALKSIQKLSNNPIQAQPKQPKTEDRKTVNKAKRGRPIADKKKEIAAKICDFVKNNPKEIPGIGKWVFLVDKFKFPYTSAKNRRGEALKYFLKRNHQKTYEYLQ